MRSTLPEVKRQTRLKLWSEKSNRAAPVITTAGRRISTSRSRPTTVAGVRAVATVKRAPLAMARFSIAADCADTQESGPSNVPSRSDT